MEFNFNANVDAALKAERGIETGVHKFTIVRGTLEKSQKGNNMLSLELKAESGAVANIYGLCVDAKWASGAENFDYSTWNELAISAGMKTGETYKFKTKDRDGKDIEVDAFKELEGKVINAGIYWEVDTYNGKEKRARKLSRVFNSDGLTVAEKQAGKTEGKTIKALENSITDYYTKAHKEFVENGGGAQEETSTQTATSSIGAKATADEDLI